MKKNIKNSQNRVVVVRTMKAPKKASRRRPVVVRDGRSNTPYPAAYLRLLRDPCASDFVHPPYAGTDAGYLVRTTDTVQLIAIGAGMTVGQTVQCSAIVGYSPYNVSNAAGTTNNGWIGGTFAPGGGAVTASYASASAPWIGTNVPNFINTSTSVARYRPVAACLKWIPTGPYASRQGLVGLAYTPSVPVLVSTLDFNGAQSASQHLSPNGSELHEVRWLPASSDESWSYANSTSVVLGAGSVQLMLRGVDGVVTSATTALISGYIEVTTVWEWTPTEVQGLTLNPRTPVPYTTQGLLSTIQNLGEFLYGAMGGSTYGSPTAKMGRDVAGAVKGGYRLLTAGYSQSVTRAPMMLSF